MNNEELSLFKKNVNDKLIEEGFTEEFNPRYYNSVHNDKGYSVYFLSDDCHKLSDCTIEKPSPICTYGYKGKCNLLNFEKYDEIIDEIYNRITGAKL